MDYDSCYHATTGISALLSYGAHGQPCGRVVLPFAVCIVALRHPCVYRTHPFIAVANARVERLDTILVDF